jgi:hypothetical protein
VVEPDVSPLEDTAEELIVVDDDEPELVAEVVEFPPADAEELGAPTADGSLEIVVAESPAEEEPKPDEEREVGEPQEPEQPEEEREDDLVAAAEELEPAPQPETALGGAEPLETGDGRRRFRLFRRRRTETPSAAEIVDERVPGEPVEPAPASPEPSVQPGPNLEPPDLEPDEPEETEARLDPWEQAAEIPEPEPLEAVVEPEPLETLEPLEPEPQGRWFRREPEPEPETQAEAELLSMAQADPEPEPEEKEKPELAEPPVEALAEQAAVGLERSRARRRAPRRARRR